eukprot:GHRQ01004665.1.p1 GENE.GHRQ01004665.1~~GHRQ01004665.1.p1  ORF type:complete len:170 (+),score=33.66 GHRQ01004665.1:141-650(+)
MHLQGTLNLQRRSQLSTGRLLATRQWRVHTQPRHGAVRSSQQMQTAAASSSEPDNEVIPPGCSRYSISIKKPLGLVLEQNKSSGIITVAEISPEGSAARTGLVAVGDQLLATSGVTYSMEEEYGEVKVKKGQTVVRVNAIGQPFKAISAAIGSHPGHMEVTLEFQRCSQ